MVLTETPKSLTVPNESRGRVSAFYYIGIVALLMLVGCDRKVDNRIVDVDIDAPATPSGLSAKVGNQRVDLTWESSPDATQYYIYRADTTATSFTLIDSTAANSYTDNKVTNGISYFYRIAGVTDSGLEGHHSPSVSAAAGVWSVVIDGNRPRTNNRTVTLSYSAPLLSGLVKVSEDVGFAGVPWQTLTGTQSFELSVGDGTKTVYASFLSSNGAQTIDIVSDSIVLDTRAVIQSVSVNGLAPDLQPGDALTFVVVAGEIDGRATVQISGLTETIELFDDGTKGDDIVDDGTYKRLWTIPPGTELDEATVTARFTDLAGNVATPLVADVEITSQDPPDAVTEFVAKPLTSRSIELGWFATSINDFQAYRIFRDDDNSVSMQSALVVTLSSQSATSYVDTGLTSSTEYFYLVVTYDRTGLTAASQVTSAMTPANTAPEPVELAVPTPVDSTGLTLTWSQSREDDFRFYRVFRSTTGPLTGGVKIAVLSTATQTTYTDSGLDLNANSYYYWVVVVDSEGLTATSDVVSHTP